MKTYLLFFIISICFYSESLAQWRPVTSGVKTRLEVISFIDDQIGYCSGNLSRTLETTDGGETWSIGPIGAVSDFDFFDKNVGFAASFGTRAMMKTIDGGLNWSYIPPPSVVSLRAVSTNSPSTAYFVGEEGVLWKIRDRENTVTVGNAGTIKRLTDVVFTSNLVGYIVVQKGEIKKTEDGGVKWNTVYLDSDAIFTEMFFVSKNTGFVVGLKGNILKTENAGASWTTLTSNNTSYLQGIDFFDTQNGIVVGNNGTILMTSDGGISWKSQSSGTTKRLMDVEMLSPSKAIVVGDDGIILKNDLILNLEEAPIENAVLAYPNPVTNNLTISAKEEINLIRVFNIQGELIVETNFIARNTYSLDFSTYNSGVYFILVKSEKGTFLKKIIR